MKNIPSKKKTTRAEASTKRAKSIRLAIVGTGGMANAHAEAFRKIPGVVLAAMCDVDAQRAQEFAAKHGGTAAVFTDLGKLLREADVDAVSNVTPDNLHAPLSLQVIAAGKHILCEKPLATNHADAVRMARAAQKAGVINMVNLSYRNAPALQKAAQLVQSGKLGEIVHVEASYLQSWLSSKVWGDWKTTPAWLWRLSTKHGSKGVLGDVGVHILDFASFPVGPVRRIQARLKTFTALKGKRLGEYPLDANDSALMQVEFANGALGVIHTTRWATGHANSLYLRIHGTKGALRLDLDKSYNELEVCLGADIHKAAWKTIKTPKTPSIYQRFITAIQTGKSGEPDFARGAEIQKALDACFESEKLGQAVKV
jgi:predicted dehydrogenase